MDGEEDTAAAGGDAPQWPLRLWVRGVKDLPTTEFFGKMEPHCTAKLSKTKAQSAAFCPYGVPPIRSPGSVKLLTSQRVEKLNF